MKIILDLIFVILINCCIVVKNNVYLLRVLLLPVNDAPHTRMTRSVNATDGGVVYVLMDRTDEIRLFSALVEEDAPIEFITPESEGTLLSWEGRYRAGAPCLACLCL